MCRALLAAACAKELPGIDRRFVLRAIHVCRPPIQFADEVKDRADADPWLQQMVLGEAAIQKAGTVRGRPNATGGADQPGTIRWRAATRRRRQHFAEALKLQPTCPEAALGMMQVAMAGGNDGDEVRRWFDRAVAAQFDWVPPYALMRQHLADQRDVKGLYAFGLECLKTGRYDSGVPNNFLLALDDIERVTASWDFLRRPGVYQDARVFFDGAVKDGERERSVFLASLEFSIAYQAGQFADAAKALDRVQGRVDRYLLEQRGIDPVAAIVRSGLLGSRLQDRIVAAQKLLDEGKRTEAAAACGNLLAGMDKHDTARPYLRNLVVRIDIETKFASGGWVNIQPEADLAGWQIAGGEWSVDDQGGLVGKSDVTKVLPKDQRGCCSCAKPRSAAASSFAAMRRSLNRAKTKEVSGPGRLRRCATLLAVFLHPPRSRETAGHAIVSFPFSNDLYASIPDLSEFALRQGRPFRRL